MSEDKNEDKTEMLHFTIDGEWFTELMRRLWHAEREFEKSYNLYEGAFGSEHKNYFQQIVVNCNYFLKGQNTYSAEKEPEKITQFLKGPLISMNDAKMFLEYQHSMETLYYYAFKMNSGGRPGFTRRTCNVLEKMDIVDDNKQVKSTFDKMNRWFKAINFMNKTFDLKVQYAEDLLTFPDLQTYYHRKGTDNTKYYSGKIEECEDFNKSCLELLIFRNELLEDK